jgi:hypothetical protein
VILADRIRQFVKENDIDPARNKGYKTVTIVAGVVHANMGLDNRMPAVCGAIDADKFLGFARVRLVSRRGPYQGSTVTWVFELK